MTEKTPDIRLRSAGAAGVYALMPLTEAGTAYVKGLEATTNGTWHEGALWFRQSYLPREDLIASGLVIVAGVGDTDEYDVPWPDPYARSGVR